jgi:FkbH-like protein
MNIEQIIQQARDAGTWIAYRLAAQKIKLLFTSNAVEHLARIRVAFLSSFTVEPLTDFVMVEAASKGLWVEAYVGGYAQFNQEILAPNSGLYKFRPEITFLMMEFNALVNKADTVKPAYAAEQAMQQIISLAETFKKQSEGILVINTFMAIPQWPLHIIASQITETLCLTNMKLLETFNENPCIQICDLDRLASYHGYRESISPEMSYMARIPFSESFMLFFAKKIVSHIKACKGMVRKCLVLDCDNTLWGGIIGEDGFDGIQIGPESPGREYVDLQQAILELYEQGIILAINSKNNYQDVIKVLREHPHMILREKHMASIQVNWNDKPSNMRYIAKELNIGLDSFVFLDDNPAERAMMREMLPEIHTIELPENPGLFARALRETNEFAKATITEEDRKRGALYVTERLRTQAQKESLNLDSFLQSLEMVVTIRQAKPADIKRAAQLTQRTNQFNLTTIRYSEADIAAMLEKPNYRIYVLKLKDKFGDMGTVGIAIVVSEKDNLRIDSFLMSCRIIGRQVEDALVNRILEDASASGIKMVQAKYVRTAKNDLASDFWNRMDFKAVESSQDSSTWQFDLSVFQAKSFKYLKFD